jgi:rare lipoprotein A
LKHQNKHRSIKSAIMTAALAGVVAIGAGIAPSLAAEQTSGAYALGSHAHLKHARHLGKSLYAETRHQRGAKPHLINTGRNGGLEGIASVYRDRITANGERMNPSAMTAAHKSLPLGSIVTVHNKRNGRSVTVRINDRGPYVTGRVIDLSPGAARIIGLNGLAPVSLAVNAGGDHLGALSTVSTHCIASQDGSQDGPGGSGSVFAVPWQETCSSTPNGRHYSHLAERSRNHPYR